MRHTTPAGAGICLVLATMLAAASAAPAFGHGSMSDPVSRSLLCFRENPESPDSDACRAAIAAGGTQPFYDWMEVNIMDAAGRHRELIPDGRLCGAGRDKYRGLDLARADWPATSLTAGADYTFRYAAPTPHGGRFDLYVTRDGYDPTSPLRWADLEAEPFLTANDPPVAGGDYVMPGRLPAGKTGRHLIYSIWQRDVATDSPEAFYTCSDVDFGASGAGVPGGPSAIPDLAEGVDSGGWATDRIAPSPPRALRVAKRSRRSVTLDWKRSSDDVGVAWYEVAVGGQATATVERTKAVVHHLAPGSRHTLGVRARDAAGNVSRERTLRVSTHS